MITVLIVLLLWSMITKPKKGVLGCGLFGFAGNVEMDDRILEKLKVLGLFNQARGEDSTGYFNGSDIVKGIDKNAKFLDFVLDGRVHLSEEPSRIFIGHTRKASGGTAHSLANAHPFYINQRLIIAHNGVITNPWSMLSAHDISNKGVDVDSHALGLIIEKDGFDVLKEYQGAAALLMHFLDGKNKLYLFHGKSKDSTYKEASEERPLYYLKEPEGIYVSSREDSLVWIHGSKDAELIKTLPHNKVFVVDNGELQDTGLYYDRTYVNGYYDEPVKQKEKSKNTTNYFSFQKEKGENIMLETFPNNSFTAENNVYYWRGRYYSTLTSLPCEGVMHLNKQGQVVSLDDPTQKRVASYCFFRGVLIKGDKEYRYLMEMSQSEKNPALIRAMKGDPEENFARWLSWYARYPITNIEDEASKVKEGRELWYIQGKPVANGAITPLYSSRNYHFKEGKLVKISSKDKREEPFFLANKPTTGGSGENGKSKEVAVTLPEEYREQYKLFTQTYGTYEQALEALQGIPYFVLEAYAGDVATILLTVTDPPPELITKIIDELIFASVYKTTSISELVDPQLNSLENYVFDACESWKEMSEKTEDDLDDKEKAKEQFVKDLKEEQDKIKEQKANEAYQDLEKIFNGVEDTPFEDVIDQTKKQVDTEVAYMEVDEHGKKWTVIGGLKFEHVPDCDDGDECTTRAPVIPMFSGFSPEDYMNDPELSYDVNDDSTKDEENEQAKEIIKSDVGRVLHDLQRYCDELSMLNASKFALDCNKEIAFNINSLVQSLYGIASYHHYSDVKTELNRLNSIR